MHHGISQGTRRILNCVSFKKEEVKSQSYREYLHTNGLTGGLDAQTKGLLYLAVLTHSPRGTLPSSNFEPMFLDMFDEVAPRTELFL